MDLGQQQFLKGKLIVYSLPAIQKHGKGVVAGSEAAPKPGDMKRLLLPHGELAQICSGEEEIRYIAYVELRTSGTRGNHYHEFKRESLYIISGEIRLWARDVDSGENVTATLRTSPDAT